MESGEIAKARGDRAMLPAPHDASETNVLAPNLWSRSGEGGRALFVSTVSGTIKGFLIPYARRLRQQGWKVDCLAAGATSVEILRAEFDACWEAPWTRNPLDLEAVRRAPGVVRELVAMQGYDVVHVHTPVAAFLTRWALRNRKPGRPCVIYTAHGFHFHSGGGRLRNFVFRMLEKLAARWTDYLVTINEEDHAAALANRFLPEDRTVRLPGIGVDVAAYANAVPPDARESVCRELEIPPGSRIVTMVAEFTRNKRQRDLVEALALMRRSDVHVLFAGKGPEEYEVEILAFKRRVFDRVHFLGVRDDVPRLLGASDLLVLPSAREGMPRAVMEALCVGVPVVGTNVRGTRDLLSTGAGAIVPVGDVEALADRISEILADPAMRRRMGERGREVIRKYEIARTLEIHDSLYSEAMKAFPRPERAILAATVPAEGRVG